MAKRHIIQYFLEIENQYFEMLESLKELKELYTEHKISDEAYSQVSQDVTTLKQNYERIAYILFLLGKPNRKNKQEDIISQSWYKALKFASKEAIVDENNDVLKHIKQLIKEGKEI